MSDYISSSKAPFKKIQREATLASQVAQQLENLILGEQLAQGEVLPTERELASLFGISRTVVREAQHSLVAKHLLELQPGNRMVVSRPTPQFVARSMSMLLAGERGQFDLASVMEVRRLLEIHIAGLAAERRTADDLCHMEAVLEKMVQEGQTTDSYVQADIDFHISLADATHNPLFSVLLYSISDVMMFVRLTGFRLPNSQQRSDRYHRAIYAQVVAGNPAGARQAMSEHLMEAEETLQQVKNEITR